MTNLASIAATLTLGIAGIAAAAGPDVRGTKTWHQPGYVLYSHNEGMAATLARKLPRIERALAAVLPGEPRYVGLPVHVFLMRESVWDDYVRTGFRLHGDFVGGRFINYLLIQSDKQDVPAFNALAHQYTHYFLRTHMGDGLPLWFEDGLATMMQTAEIYETFANFNEPRLPPGHRVIPMNSLLRIGRKSSDYALDEPARFFFQSLTLVHRGLLGDAAFRKQTLAYVADVQGGASIDEALAKNFHMTADELGVSMLSHSRAPVPWKHSVTYDEPPPVVLPAGEPMADIDALQFVVRIMFDSGATHERIADALAAAERMEPDNLRVRVLQLRLAARQNDDRRFDEIWNQIAPATRDPALARAAGLALFERVRLTANHPTLTRDARLEVAGRAFDLLMLSERALPVDLEAAWALGILSAQLERDPEFALARVDQALRIAPANRDLTLAKNLLERPRK